MHLIRQYIFLKQNHKTRAKLRPAFRSNAVYQCTIANAAKRHNHSNRGYVSNFAHTYFYKLIFSNNKTIRTNNFTTDK